MAETGPTTSDSEAGPAQAPTCRPEWTPETVARFWNYWTARRDCDDWYFSYYYGQALLHCARWFGVLQGEVLDYGFSRGLLLPRLLDAGVGVTGVEFSNRAVAEASRRHAGHPSWRGAVAADALPTPLPDMAFDLIYCVEVFEHLVNEWVDPTVAELHRLAKPGGYVLITTPCNEDLERQLTYCPFCTAEFHDVQHVRSVTPEWLRELLSRHGFEVAFCQGINLDRFQRDYTPFPTAKWRFKNGDPFRLAGRIGAHWVRRVQDRRSGDRPGRAFVHAAAEPGPHLCAIAKRRESS